MDQLRWWTEQICVIKPGGVNTYNYIVKKIIEHSVPLMKTSFEQTRLVFHFKSSLNVFFCFACSKTILMHVLKKMIFIAFCVFC